MSDRFFLGGQDLEMQESAALIRRTLGAEAVIDKSLAWGAGLSHYRDEIEQAIRAGHRPVAVELGEDMPADWPALSRLWLIDHHGARKDEPSSLRQVFDRLKLPEAQWTRRCQLIAANDTAHVEGMRAMGASLDEMRDIRAQDRRAQGITPAEEQSGLAALEASNIALGGRLRIVHLPHDRSATVMDPLALEPRFSAPHDAMLVGRLTLQVFGPRAWIDALARAFPMGWSGGSGPHGFFGVALTTGQPERAEALRILENIR